MSLLNNPPAEKRILWQQGAPKAWNVEHIAKEKGKVFIAGTKGLGVHLYLFLDGAKFLLDSSQGYNGSFHKVVKGTRYKAEGAQNDHTLLFFREDYNDIS